MKERSNLIFILFRVWCSQEYVIFIFYKIWTQITLLNHSRGPMNWQPWLAQWICKFLWLSIFLMKSTIPTLLLPMGVSIEPDCRFWVAARLQQLYFTRSFGRLTSANELVVDSGLITRTFLSDCQVNLFGPILSNDPSWQEMRTLVVGRTWV